MNEFKRKLSSALKRGSDILVSLIGLTLASPLLLAVMFRVWKTDKHQPFYIADRVGKNFKTFKMIKLRSMIKNADKSGVDSTSSEDSRITPVGHFIRGYKLDELTQLANVLKGDMSLIGPRPNVKRETDLYTNSERNLLNIRPGITDFSSIVFSDEGEILSGTSDPDLAYNQLIRPWKSRLGLFYIENMSLALDLKLLYLTALSLISRQRALLGVHDQLTRLNAPKELCEIALRQKILVPSPPPGSNEIVKSRKIED
jgi:lipopolysaccharide/colanic/teichoic acid biosynthesis glycosyltransferase